MNTVRLKQVRLAHTAAVRADALRTRSALLSRAMIRSHSTTTPTNWRI